MMPAEAGEFSEQPIGNANSNLRRRAERAVFNVLWLWTRATSPQQLVDHLPPRMHLPLFYRSGRPVGTSRAV